MKLIRLTTDKDNCEFHSRFSEDITLKPNSKMALQSLSMESVASAIKIDGLNDRIEYALSGSGTEKEVFLDHNSTAYDRNTIDNLLDDMELKLNKTLGRESYELGKQFQVERNTAGKCEIQCQSRTEANYRTEFLSNVPERTVNTVADTPVLEVNSGGTWKKPPSVNGSPAPAGDNNTYMTYLNEPIAKGSGYFRCKALAQTDTTIATGGDGFIIGLTNKDLAPIVNAGNDIDDTDITYGVYLPSRLVGGTGGTQVYQSVLDGVFANVAGADVYLEPTANTKNDRLEVAIHNNRVYGYVWRDSNHPTNPSQKVEIFNEAYDGTTNLYPVLIIRGEGNKTKVNNIEITIDPFFKDSYNIEVDDGSDDTALGSPSYPKKSTIRAENFMEFESEELANQLGYRTARYPENGYYEGLGFTNTAHFQLDLLELSDAFLVQLNNIRLESYDDFDENGNGKGRKQDLLAVIPHSDHNAQVIYQPNYPLWIELNNRDEKLLRDIKAIILRKDYSNVQNRGLTSMTILIKGPEE